MPTDAIFPTPGGPLTIYVSDAALKPSLAQEKAMPMTASVAKSGARKGIATIVVETKPGWVRVIGDDKGNYTVTQCDEPVSEAPTLAGLPGGAEMLP